MVLFLLLYESVTTVRMALVLLSTRVASAQFSFGVARGCKGLRAITIIIISIIVATFIIHFDCYCCYSCGYYNYYS